MPFVAELLASWSPSSDTTGAGEHAGHLGRRPAAGSCPNPTSTLDVGAFVTVYNPGPTDPRLESSLRGGSSLEVAIPGRPRWSAVALDDAAGALVVTAPQPIVVGLTLLGDAGASISTAIPDPSYAG